MPSIQSITIIGTGKAAKFFSSLFHSNGIKITCIIGRELEKAKALALPLQAQFSDDFSQIPECDLVLLAVKDDVITELCKKVNFNNSLVVHCAGSVSMEMMGEVKRKGVIYPLQSLSSEVLATQVPILFEANNAEDVEVLRALLNSMNLECREVHSAQRLKYHLAAVFANNFTNAILGATFILGEQNDLDFQLLKPLIRATFEKVLNGDDPNALQTGPAKRGDEATIHRHLELMQNDPDLQALYLAISNFIKKKSN